MNRFKFQAFVEEFPFLSKCNTYKNGNERDYHNCDGIVVKRATAELMTHVPQYDGATGSLVGIDDGERFDFVLADSSVIRDAIQSAGYCRHNEAHTNNEDWSGEIVLEAIDKHDVAETLQYVVSVRYGYDVSNHYSGPEYNIVIFKPSKDFTWQELIEEAKKKAKAEVLAEANF